MVSVDYRSYTETHRAIREDAQRPQNRKLPGVPAKRASLTTSFLSGVHFMRGAE